MRRKIDFYCRCNENEYGVALVINGAKFEAYSDDASIVSDVYLTFVDELEAVYGETLYTKPLENSDILSMMMEARSILGKLAKMFGRMAHDGSM